jgi:L-alanine-DL-glutamate epimerase-like enolase superfamily enzyme
MSTWQGYITEARRFWEVAQAFDCPGYTNQAVSNAIYAAIAAADALGVQRIGESAGDHPTPR